jgi:hypothetical protein
MKYKRDGFEWNFVPVYGAAQDAQKPDFLAELVRMCDNQDLPMMVGGDFNIIRKREEKNNDNINARWPFIFNSIIQSLNLREIALSGRQYTWASRRDNPTYEKLDRILSMVDWEQKFPLISVRALSRTGLVLTIHLSLLTLGLKHIMGISRDSLLSFSGSDKKIYMRW